MIIIDINGKVREEKTGDTLDLDDAQRKMYLELLGEDVS